MSAKGIKKVKKSITEVEYNILMRSLKNDDEMKPFVKQRFYMIFLLLYNAGLRVSELNSIKYRHISEIIDSRQTIITTSKTKRERILYFSERAAKEIKEYFNYSEDMLEDFVVTSLGRKNNTFSDTALTRLVNTYLKKVLGEAYTSHSFRQGLLTEFGKQNINPATVRDFIGHKNVQTTLGYMKPTEKDIIASLVR